MVRVRALFSIIAVAGLLGAAACSNDTATPAPSPTDTTSSTAPSSSASPIADAAATRDKLLQIAAQPGAYDKSGDLSIPAWHTEFPGMTFAGAGIPADPTTVSGFQTVESKSKGVGYLAFAVKDSAGTCAGGVIEISSDGATVSKTSPVSGTFARCDGSTVGETAGY